MDFTHQTVSLPQGNCYFILSHWHPAHLVVSAQATHSGSARGPWTQCFFKGEGSRKIKQKIFINLSINQNMIHIYIYIHIFLYRYTYNIGFYRSIKQPTSQTMNQSASLSFVYIYITYTCLHLLSMLCISMLCI